MLNTKAKTVIYPVVYCNHSEKNNAITALFVGFDCSYYEAHHCHFSSESVCKLQLQLTQLYPVLVHALLFGGYYATSAVSISAMFNA